MLSFSARGRFESVHPGLPRLLARLHPLDRLVERVGLHPARPPLRLPAADDQSRALEHLEVARDRGQAHRERLRELVHGRLALRETGQDRAARRVGESRVGEAELVAWHVTVRLINAAIKYHRPPERNSGLGSGCKLALVNELGTVRVAAVQATPVILDADATV